VKYGRMEKSEDDAPIWDIINIFMEIKTSGMLT
jgi:hypothetical protein